MFASHISAHVVQTSTLGDNTRGAASMQLTNPASSRSQGLHCKSSHCCWHPSFKGTIGPVS